MAPISACIPRYWFSEDKYWFVIECVLENGRTWELQRYYEDFYDFQIALLTEFPDEAGNTGTQKRTLPYMPGPVNYVTDQITEGRKNNLDAYVKNLLQQPPYISRCALVRQFFHPREGDLEVDPTAESEEGRYSGASGLSGEADSRQGSSANLNSGYGGLSAAPPRQQQQPNMGYPQQGQDRRQPSGSLAAPPLVSQQSSNSQATLGGALKVKIYFGDDVFAIRVQKDIAFQQLYEKIRERLKIPGQEEIVVSYKDERSGERRQLGSDQDLDEALVSGDKLALFVDYSDLGN